ncbi:MAG TPA: TetR/AcrR family transcriptional regulator [Kouleothrix sp.]|nr:TetR/AcrR family transcriptional regulator [Kouleothrix sp.]
MSNDIALRERILAESTRLFVSAGYNGISMREIAEAVGVSKAGLYYHFKDKEDLFVAILRHGLARIAQTVAEAQTQPGGIHAQLDALVRGLFAQPSEQRTLIQLAGQELAHLSPDVRTEFSQSYYQQFIGQIRALLEQAMAGGELRPQDPQTLTWLLLGMMYPFFSSEVQRDPQVNEQIISQLLALFFTGAARGTAE